MNTARMRSMALAGVAALGAAAALTAGGQEMSGASLERQPAAAIEHTSSSSQPLGEVIREVIDLETGDRWLLVRDMANPGGPGRMVRAKNAEAGSGVGAAESRVTEGGRHAGDVRQRPIIQAGDALIVEEHTAVVDARLEAVALGSAATGTEFRAQLKIGGKVVRVVALAAGRARLEIMCEQRPQTAAVRQ